MRTLSSSILITPDHSVHLIGYAAKARESRGVRSSLESNAILFDTSDGKAVLVSVDACFVGSDFISSVRGHLNDPAVELIFVASHTHYGPSLDSSKPKLGQTDTEWFAEAAALIASQVNQLIAGSTVETKARYGHKTCSLSVNRRRILFWLKKRFPFVQRSAQMLPNPQKLVERHLQVMSLHGTDGVPVAVVWSWPCHAVEASDSSQINAAYPGAVRDAIRKSVGHHLPIVYLPGFCGDIRPRMTKRMIKGGFLERFSPPSESEVIAFENEACSVALNALSAAHPVDVSSMVAFRKGGLPFNELLIGTSFEMPISYLECGSFSLTALGAEVCSPYFGHLGFDPERPEFFTGCSNHTFGYLPTDVQISEGGYEVDRFMPFFGLAGKWASNVMPRVIRAVRALQDDRKPLKPT